MKHPENREVPVTWAWAALDDVAEMSSGGTPSRSRSEYYGGKIPWVRIADLNDGAVCVTEQRITEAGLAASAARLVPPGTLLVAMYGSIGKLGILGIEAATNQAICALEPWAISTKYLYWYLLSQRSALLKLGRGGTQANISQAILKNLWVPIAPRAEQDRIVAAIERNIRKVRDSSTRLADAAAGIASYERAVYAEAFSGGDARVWPRQTLGEVTTAITSGSRDWKPYYGMGSGVFVMAQNVRPRKLDLSTVFHVDPPQADSARVRSAIKHDDVLVTIVGAGTGTVAHVPHELDDHWVCQSVALVRPRPPLSGAFLELFLNAPGDGRAQIEQRIYGQGRPHLSFEDLRSIEVPLPNPDVQREVVLRVGSALAAGEAVRRAIEDAARWRQDLEASLLRKAFRGQLVDQEPTDEPASALLERIGAERQTPSQKATRSKEAGRKAEVA